MIKSTYLLITIDFEIFGYGTGDILETIVEPMKRIKKTFGRYWTNFIIAGGIFPRRKKAATRSPIKRTVIDYEGLERSS